MTYPQARRDDTVDDYFGQRVADPYRWMEDPTAPEVRAFIDAQNVLTQAFLDVPQRAAIKAELQARFAPHHVPYGRPSVRCGDDYFYSFNLGQDQAAVLRRHGVDGTPEVVLDPNGLSADGSSILMGVKPSPNARWLAYGVSRGGSDWQEYHVRDLTTGQDLPETLAWCKFTMIVWKADSSGFFYNRFPAPQPGQEMLAGNFGSQIYLHKVGTAQADDVLIYEDRAHPEYILWPQGSDDGQFLLVKVVRSSVGENAYVGWKIDSGEGFRPLLPDFDSSYGFIGSQGATLYFITKAGAPRQRLIAFDFDQPARDHWREVIPESADLLNTALMVGGQIIAVYMHNAYSEIKRFALDGAPLGDLPLPAMGTVPTYTLEANAHDNDFLFTFTSFLIPLTIYRYDTTSNQLMVFQASATPVQPDDYETKLVFYPSTDGAQVSLFVTHRKGLKLDGSHPALIYAYGGFDASVNPEFDVPAALWLEHGGVYAIANLRGGGEYGEEWHKAGMLGQKQHVFDDMIHAGEWLIANGYTSRQKLVIRGASNGGLLVAACITQRPDLFGAALCGVPVIDMLRYHRFTSGRLWTSEYGCADTSAEDFAFLHAYSPLHNVRAGVTYPPTLIWSSDGDDRVVPMHSLKFTATLQAADAGTNPLLLRFGTQAGHGTVNVRKVIDEEGDFLTFLTKTVGWSLQA
ncbi:MAG TPA: prolyl oligopeptidase family serine peptidase [Phototrophicaceae bacterium]|nr:prolyl oligopeptidase family serine peptidase [Phototrophicaceae bacterium]